MPQIDTKSVSRFPGGIATETLGNNGLTAGAHLSGAGTPESSVTAPVGCLYLRTNGAAGSTLYVKETGVSNTGWSGVNTQGSIAISPVATDLTAAGTTRADALQLSAQSNNITTTAASTGVILPTGVIGYTIRVFNNGANTLAVYANGSETINGTAGSTGVTQATTKVADYTFVKANTWISVAVN